MRENTNQKNSEYGHFPLSVGDLPSRISAANATEKKTTVMTIRSSHRRCSIRKDVLRNLAKFTGKHLFQCLFFNKVAGAEACNFIKNRDSGTGVFLCILQNLLEHLFYRTPHGDCFWTTLLFLDRQEKNTITFALSRKKFQRKTSMDFSNA